MSSIKEDEAAMLDALLGPMSLGEPAERKVAENNEEPDKNNETPAKQAKFCSWCEKESNTLKMCNGCKCVWYCDVNCRDRHRREHRKECRRIKKELDKRGGKLDLGTEEDVGPLGKVPPQEECPICMQPLPLNERLRMYFECCGKTICAACNHLHGIQTKKVNIKRVKRKQPRMPRACAFCRTAVPESDEESLARLHKRVELKDSRALLHMALYHGLGGRGLSVDQTKCIDLFRQAADLGSPEAQAQLGNFYDNGAMGLKQNEEEARKYNKDAAEGGNLFAWHDLGCAEARSGDRVAAMRHLRLSASGGLRKSMDLLIDCCFRNGSLQHGHLAETLRPFYLARKELKSEDRDQFIAYLKRTGEYEAEDDYF